MGLEERTYSKRIRLDQKLKNEFVSCGQFLTASTEVFKDKDQLRDRVLNRAIRHSLNQGYLKQLCDLCDHSRLNGSTIELHIQANNWLDLVEILGKKLNKIDEFDLIAFCLEEYLKEVKVKGCLP